MAPTIRTRATELFGIDHPVVLGGMAGATSPALVAAVSGAGGLGVMGVTGTRPEDLGALAGEIRDRTNAPFGFNLLLFRSSRELVAAVLAEAPPLVSTAWPDARQDLAELFARAHQAGSLVMHMVSTLPEAITAEAAGADVIVAQGTEGGGHVGTMGTSVLVPMVARRVRVPVLAAGGLADGAGLVAALALGAEGILLGTRFLATPEAPVHEAMKRAIVDSDGHDTLITEITDVAAGNVWPGAYARVKRNRLIESWIGREGELRRRRVEVREAIARAQRDGDTENAVVYIGQTAGLIDSIQPAGRVVEAIVAEAAEIIRARLVPTLASTAR
jgi:NAD(P)H-dependent flavin oxidoreductase YrpB (nitropropane dioxygenase family)